MARRHLAACAVLVALGATGTAAAPALASASLASPDTTAFTIAGGGTRAPADGVPATDARLELFTFAGLSNGSTALMVTVRRAQDPAKVRLPLWRLDATGILRAVPGVPEAASVAATPDGSVGYVVPVEKGNTTSSRILRVDPGSGIAQLAVDLTGRLDSVYTLVALDDGALVATDGYTTLRVAPDGAISPAGPTHRKELTVQNLLAQPGGAVLTIDTRGAAQRIAADGSVTSVPAFGRTLPLAALGDGSLVFGRATRINPDIEEQFVDRLELRGPDGATRPLVSGRPGLGDGDGGRPSGMRITAGSAAPGAAGSLLLTDQSHLADELEYPSSAARIDGDRLRLLSPFGTTPPAALALTPATYEGWPEGRASLLSGRPGQAALKVRRPGSKRVVANASGAVPAGFSELRLPTRLAPGPYDLQLTVASADGGQTIARMHVDTTRVLKVARVKNLVDLDQVGRGGGDPGQGSSFEAGRCSRKGRSSVTCQIIERSYGPSGSGSSCVGRETYQLGPDGLHRRTRATC